MTFCGCGHRLSDELRTLQTCLGQNQLTRLLFRALLAIIILYRYCLQARYHKPDGKCTTEALQLSGYFTYPVWQRSARGQRGPDNQGCTVIEFVILTAFSDYLTHLKITSKLSMVHTTQIAWMHSMRYVDVLFVVNMPRKQWHVLTKLWQIM